MHGSAHDFVETVSGFLGGYYLSLALMNALAAFYLWHYKHRLGEALTWLVLGAALVILSPLAMSGSPPAIPSFVQDFVNWATGPVVYSVGTTAILAFLFVFRRFFVQP